MPVALFVDAPHRMVYSRATGRLTYADSVAHGAALAAHPDFRADFHQWIDLRAAVIAMTSREIEAFALGSVFSPKTRRAFLVSHEVNFGLVREFEAYREFKGEGAIRVFSEVKDALAWLELAAEPGPEIFREPA